jgi:septal ring factor EnvC (AmiA/AmiB activator)
MSTIEKVENKAPELNIPFLITGIVLVLVIVGMVIFGMQTSAKIKADSSSISSLKTLSTSMQSQISSIDSQISTLDGNLSTANQQISTLKSQLGSDETAISSLKQQLTSAGTQITALQDQVTSVNSQIANLNTQTNANITQISSISNQISSINSQLATLSSSLSSLTTSLTDLQSTVASLSTEVDNLTSTSWYSHSTTLASSQSLSQGYGEQTLFATFFANYAGYLYISGTSTSSTSYITVKNTTSGTLNSYTFGTGTTVSAPIQAGAIEIYFGNSASSGSVTAVLSVVYTY